VRIGFRIHMPSDGSIAVDVSTREQWAGGLAKLAQQFWLPLLAGGFVRLLYPLGSNFPLNDGGMFFVLVQDLVKNGYRLPAYTTYNGGAIPFAYPPAAFYVAALLARIWPLIDVLRVLPSLLATGALVVFFLLARDVLIDALGPEAGSRATTIAAFAYALIPSSFQWQIMGGGLTRSFGYLASLTTLWLLWRFYVRWQWHYLAGGCLGLALAVASHPELGWFTVFSLGLIFLARGTRRGRSGVVATLGLGAGALMLTSPWWLLILLRHGLAPYLAAFSTGEHGHAWALPFQATSFTGEPWLTVWACLGVLGLLACLRDRRFILPMWLLAVYVLDPRKGMSLGAVPLAMMIGYAVERLLRPQLTGWSGKVAFGCLVAYSTVAALALAVMPLPSWAVLPAGEKEAMEWVREHTPADSRFLVISSSWLWARDQTGEWFPALAGRTSLTTVQGREWVPGGTDYSLARERFPQLQDCMVVDCLAMVAPHSHVYISKTPVAVDPGVPRDLTLALRRSLAQSPRYTLIYSNASADVYEVQRESAAEEPAK
jgi:hypothetical protein